jgi:hypothetical protein
MPSSSGEDDDRVRAILTDAVEGVNKLRVILAVKVRGPPLLWNSTTSTPCASRAIFRLLYAVKYSG